MNFKKENIDVIIAACKRKNTNAQVELYNRFSKMMYHTALNILKDPMLAEDAIQESFVKAFSKLKQYSGKDQFGGWLKKIVINKSITLYNRENKFNTQELNIETTKADTQEAEEEPASETQNLLKALDLLKPKQALLLKLYYLEGYDHEEISAFLNISYANCRTSLSRAREQLRIKLDTLSKNEKTT